MNNCDDEAIVQYLTGLFDGGGSIYFRISKSNRELGYRITPTVIIHIGSNDELYGMIDEFFVGSRIQYKISETNTSGRRVEIDTRDNVERFLELIREKTTQHHEEIEFILEKLYPARDSGRILNEDVFVQMVKFVEKIQPRRCSNDGVKYRTEYFLDEWDVTDPSVEIREHWNEPDISPSREYVAGVFDGAGKIRPVIHQTETTSTGFSLSIRASITKSWLRNSAAVHVQSYLDELGVPYNVNEQGNRISIQVTSADGLKELLDDIGPGLIANFRLAAAIRSQIIPAVDSGYHREQQGLHDIVALFEAFIDEDVHQRKYTSEFFRNQWENVERRQTVGE